MTTSQARPPGGRPEDTPEVRDADSVIGTENFPVALRVLPRAYRRHLAALYRYARFVDDLGDEAPGDRLAALDAVETGVRGLYDGKPVTHPVLRQLTPTVAACDLPVDPLLRLIEANRVDQRVSRYRTFDELLDYCRLSANPVGELVLHVFGQATPERIALSDHVCTALQLVEHLQDVAEDRRRDRVYLPAEELDRFEVTEAELDRTHATPALRRLVHFQAVRAGDLLDRGAPLVAALTGWSRVAVAGYVAGGRAALTALAGSGFDPLPGPPHAPRRAVLAGWLRELRRSVR